MSRRLTFVPLFNDPKHAQSDINMLHSKLQQISPVTFEEAYNSKFNKRFNISDPK